MYVPHEMSSPFFQIINGIVGLPGGNFIFMTVEEIILRNWQRTTLEYREHLTRIVLGNIKEAMNNDEWAVASGYGSALLKDQPNGGEG